MFVPDSPSAYKVYEQKNAIQKDHTLGSYFIDENKYQELKGFKVNPRDIIVSCAGTIGETYVMPKDIRAGIINQALMLIRLHLNDIQDFYLLYFDFILKAEAAKEGKGTAIKNIPPFDVLKSFLIPIPPLAEQGRILKEVNRLMSYVDNIDESTNKISSLICSAKSKILDLAIHGKLVPQDPSDEPASELLKRINPNAVVSCDNPHYADIPKSWEECTLGDVCLFESGYAYSSDLYRAIGIPLIRISNIVDGNINIDDCVYIKGDELTKNVHVNQGDLLIAMSGATTGKIGIYSYEDDAILNQRVGNIKIKNTSVLTRGYRDLFIKAIKPEIEKNAYGGAQPNISGKMICDFAFPLPPYNEQLRIVSTSNNILLQLDLIEKTLHA